MSRFLNTQGEVIKDTQAGIDKTHPKDLSGKKTGRIKWEFTGKGFYKKYIYSSIELGRMLLPDAFAGVGELVPSCYAIDKWKEEKKYEEWTKKYYDNNSNLQTKTMWVATNETKSVKAYTVANIWTDAITGNTVKITIKDATPEDIKKWGLYTAQDVKKWNLPRYGENTIQEEQDFLNNPNSC